MKNCWILTKQYNDYNQHGEYFCCAFEEKPTVNQLMQHIDCNIETARSIIDGNGKGRINNEYMWYLLKKDIINIMKTEIEPTNELIFYLEQCKKYFKENASIQKEDSMISGFCDYLRICVPYKLQAIFFDELKKDVSEYPIYSVFWYSIDKEGYNKRVEHLKRTIERLKNK